jgi:hypothetical protein
MTTEILGDNRYTLSQSDAGLHLHARDCGTNALAACAACSPNTYRLVDALVAVANRRVGCFDPLLNSIEALDALFVFCKHEHPALLEAGVLQPIVALTAALHDHDAGARAALLVLRGGFNGAYRSREEMQVRPAEDAPSMGGRPTQLYHHQLEALAVVALEGLLRSHDMASASTLLDLMLKEERIRLPAARRPEDLKRLDAITVARWKKNLDHQDNPAKARQYSVAVYRRALDPDLQKCSDTQHACAFARRLLVKLRLHQPDLVIVN